MQRAERAFNERDLDDLARIFTDETIWRPSITGGDTVEGGEYVGMAGFRRYLDDVAETWADLTVEFTELEARGSGAVLGCGTLKGIGRASGVSVARPVWYSARIESGKVASLVVNQTRDEALADLESGD